jgi:hypothetical protein
MESEKHSLAAMMDLELENLLLECDSLLPNMLRLGGPVDLLFHVLLNAQNQLRGLDIVIMFLDRYGEEYLSRLGDRIEGALGDKTASLKILRKSAHYLPSSLNSLARMLRALSSRRTNANRILVEGWIIPALIKRYPEHSVFISSVGNWSDSEVRPELRRFIRRFFKGHSPVLTSSTSLRRTDSVTETPHFLVSSSSSISSSASSSSRSGSSSQSSSPSSSPEMSLFENSRECCEKSGRHQAALQDWLRANRGEFKAWFYDGNNFVSEDGVLDKKMKRKLVTDLGAEIDMILASPMLRAMRKKLSAENALMGRIASAQRQPPNLINSLRLNWANSGHEIVIQ